MDLSFLVQNSYYNFEIYNYWISIIILFFLFYYRELIAFKFNLIDFPDQIRKLHKTPTPVIGGLILLIFILSFIFLNNDVNLYLFIFWVSAFFLIGLLDDIKKLSSNTKILSLTAVILFFLFIDNSLIIDQFYSEILTRNINLNYKNNFILPIFFTTLSCLLFFNAMNMIDGYNGVCSSTFFIYFLTIIIIFPINIELYPIIILILIFLIFFNFFNLRGKIFLGDSGNYLLSSVLIFYILKLNFLFENISAEKIFLIMSIPGLDMFRLFIERLYKNKNPFNPDRNHLHHLIDLYFSNKLKTILFYILIILISVSFIKIFNFNYIIGITFICFYYLILLKILKN